MPCMFYIEFSCSDILNLNNVNNSKFKIKDEICTAWLRHVVQVTIPKEKLPVVFDSHCKSREQHFPNSFCARCN
jgi:hypothetical protein